jgi:hypothetical protein
VRVGEAYVVGCPVNGHHPSWNIFLPPVKLVRRTYVPAPDPQ